MRAVKRKLPGQDSNLDKENQNLLSSPSKPIADTLCVDSPCAVDRALTNAQEYAPDLVRIVEAWPTLPDAIRQAVLKLIS